MSPATCAALQGAGYSFDPSDLNGASIAIGSLAGVQTVTRKVTNVGGGPASYTASVSGMTGITVEVTPPSLTLNPGETKSFTVAFTRTTATLNAYTGGQLSWSDGTHAVRIPMVVFPVALAAPAQVSGTGVRSRVQQRRDQVGSSTSGTAAEAVNFVNPAPDTYTVVVQGWGVVVSSPFKLHAWVLGSADAGNMAVAAPAAATIGTTAAINLTFSGLAPATKYLGSVAYSGSAGLAPTIVRVDTP